LAKEQAERDQRKKDLTRQHILASQELVQENDPDYDENEEVQTLDRTSRSSLI